MRLNTDVNMGVSFTVMPTHNCADEDCPDERSEKAAPSKADVFGDW
jgi:hypothetical protein